MPREDERSGLARGPLRSLFPMPTNAPQQTAAEPGVRPLLLTGGWSRGGVRPVAEESVRIGAAEPRPLEALRAAFAAGPGMRGDGWCGWLSYDAGRRIEARASARAREGGLPLAELRRVEMGVGGEASAGGTSGARGRLVSEPGRDGYVASAARVLELIRAGDIYQANLAHRLRGRFSGSGAALYGRLASAARPLHGMYMESGALEDGRAVAVLSLSPELFLSFDARTRRLVTRPMKGTRAGHGGERELLEAEKDRAELAMIVDLMRNDLGRVCEFGSVRVEEARRIERHATGRGAVLQATATVSGRVREGLGACEILAATFPPGSVTGTPKIRAMQVIDELEPFARGPYCGCLGVFADDGSFELAVAIRTAVILGRRDEAGGFADAELSYCVGAGIVADSEPEAEWAETLAKAGVLAGEFEIG